MASVQTPTGTTLALLLFAQLSVRSEFSTGSATVGDQPGRTRKPARGLQTRNVGGDGGSSGKTATSGERKRGGGVTGADGCDPAAGAAAGRGCALLVAFGYF